MYQNVDTKCQHTMEFFLDMIERFVELANHVAKILLNGGPDMLPSSSIAVLKEALQACVGMLVATWVVSKFRKSGIYCQSCCSKQ